ncbi:hypothetical protein [Longimicrobium sp.]|uniref:hypothetical protein n=1 Tax=Longimicrobium sp. TaxID=2029185 RepID=UPI003B3A578B
MFTAVISIMSHAQFITARQLISARQEIARNVAKTSLPSPASRGGLVSAQVLVNTSVAEYRRAVVKAEAQGKDFAYIQRRLAPYLHKDEALHYIATQRFGAGNPEMEAYVAAHQSRRAAFFSALGAGVRYRELFPRSAIVRYVATGTHSDEMWPLPVSTIIELLDNWREVLLRYHNYYVGISDHALPIKYHVIDAECVILHEPVGKGDDIRLNSLFIYGRDVASIAVKDFDLVWGLIDPEWRDRERIARWISEELVPLANRRLP